MDLSALKLASNQSSEYTNALMLHAFASNNDMWPSYLIENIKADCANCANTVPQVLMSSFQAHATPQQWMAPASSLHAALAPRPKSLWVISCEPIELIGSQEMTQIPLGRDKGTIVQCCGGLLVGSPGDISP